MRNNYKQVSDDEDEYSFHDENDESGYKNVKYQYNYKNDSKLNSTSSTKGNIPDNKRNIKFNYNMHYETPVYPCDDPSVLGNTFNKYSFANNDHFNYSNWNIPLNTYNYDNYESYQPSRSSNSNFVNSKTDHLAVSSTKQTGKKKIKLEYIEGRNKRNVTFSKRKKGIMKKAYELNILTGSEILLLVASESGHVYTFATPKLRPMINDHEHIIQSCLSDKSEGTLKDKRYDPDEDFSRRMNPN